MSTYLRAFILALIAFTITQVICYLLDLYIPELRMAMGEYGRTPSIVEYIVAVMAGHMLAYIMLMRSSVHMHPLLSAASFLTHTTSLINAVLVHLYELSRR